MPDTWTFDASIYEEHTEGPWEARGKTVVQVGSSRRAAPNAYAGGVCNCLGGGYGTNKYHPVNLTAEANARLIADAPKLLAQIETLEARVAGLERERDEVLDTLERITTSRDEWQDAAIKRECELKRLREKGGA